MHMCRQLESARFRLREYQTRLRVRHPRSVLRDYQQRTMEYEDRLRAQMKESLVKSRYRFSIYLEKMKGLSPLEKLNQGYAYVADSQGKTLKSIGQAKTGDMLSVYVQDGMIETVVKEAKKNTESRIKTGQTVEEDG